MQLAENGKLYLWGWSASATSRESWWSPYIWEMDPRDGKLLRKIRETDPMSGGDNRMGGAVADRACCAVTVDTNGVLYAADHSDSGFHGVCHFSGNLNRYALEAAKVDGNVKVRPCAWVTYLATLPARHVLAVGRCNFAGVPWTKDAWQENDPRENPEAWLRVYSQSLDLRFSTPIRGILPYAVVPLSEERFILVGKSWGRIHRTHLEPDGNVNILAEPNPGIALVRNALFGKPCGKDDGYYMVVDWVPELKEEDFGNRTREAEALAAKGAAAVPELTGMLKDGDTDARRRAAWVMASIGSPAVPALAEVLESGNAEARRWALVGLYTAGPEAAAAAPAVAKALKDEDVVIRRYAAYALGRIGPGAKAAAPALAAALKDKDQGIRRYAVRALGAVEPDAAVAVPALAAALEDGNAEIRSAAVNALGMMGPAAAPGIPALVAASKRGDIRRRVFATMSEIGPAALPALITVVKDRDASDRGHAVDAIGGMGPEAASALPELIKVLKDKDVGIRRSAVSAVARIGPDAVVAALPALSAALKDEDKKVRGNVVKALGTIGPKAAGALSALSAVVKDEDDRRVRSGAVKVLGEIGAAAVPTLVEALKEEALVQSAAGALARIGPDAEAAVPALTEAAKNADARTRRSIDRALQRIKSKRK